MSEFALIERLQQRFAEHSSACRYVPAVGIGDDAAVLDVPSGQQLLVTTDTLVSGVHFLADDRPANVAAKALAVNLSDLAAMGAEPAWFFLAITMPAQDLGWWDDFTAGLLEVASQAGIQLAGGDTTRGPLSVTITAMGLTTEGKALRREGARPGDLVVVSGQPGLAAFALHEKLAGREAPTLAQQALLRPEPRLLLGRALRGLASACVDVSDGLAADLGHILKASHCGAELRLQNLPTPPALASLTNKDRWKLQLAGGDDYELCFTLPPQHEALLPGLQAQSGVALQVIGSIVEGSGMKLVQEAGQEFALDRFGYEHFSITR
jgi:thiamine-monophosphate kinase